MDHQTNNIAAGKAHESEQAQQAHEAQQKILQAIRSGEVKARPRWYFVLEATLMITGAIILFFLILYLASFIIFALRESGLWFAPSFGAAGWYSLFVSLPWFLILLLIVFMLILAVLVHTYSVAYERPTVYLFVGIVLIVGLGGLLIAETPFHNDLMVDSRGGGLPVIGIIYRDYGIQTMDNDIHRGTIIATTTNGIIIVDENGETSTVFFIGPAASETASGSVGPTIGNEVVIFGPRSSSGTINEQGMATAGE